MNKFLTSVQLAELLGVTEGTLRNWRAAKQGPPFVKLGKSKQAEVRYKESDINSWINKNSKVASGMNRKVR